MTDMVDRMFDQLHDLGAPPIQQRVGDVPYVELEDGTELVADGQGSFDLWTPGGFIPIRFDISPEEAQQMLRERTP